MSKVHAIVIAAMASCSPLVFSAEAAAQSHPAPVTEAGGVPQSAPQAAEPDAGEIVVTAQRRAENLQRIPLAISAFSGDELAKRGIQRPEDLAGSIPNLKVGSGLGVNSVFLRGVGSAGLAGGNEGSIAYHVDGVYVQSPRAQVAGLFDVERVEVVRGPQGDLYGRNATGGSINVITRKPTDDFTANGQLSYGNYNWVSAEAGLGGAVIKDRVNVRVAGYFSGRDGFGKNIATGNDVDSLHEYGFRGILDFDLAPELKLEISGDYYKASDSMGGWHIFGSGRAGSQLTAVTLGGTPVGDIRDISASNDTRRDVEVYGFSGALTYSLTDSIDVKSVTGYRNSVFTLTSDIAGAPTLTTAINQYERTEQVSQELNLLFNGNGWNAVLGGYYFNSEVNFSSVIPLESLAFRGPPFSPGAVFNPSGNLKTDAYAAFLHGEVEVTDRLKAIVGLRYSYEKRTSDGQFRFPVNAVPTGGGQSWDAFTPKFVLEYRPTDRTMIYAGASRGFKSGTFVIGQVNPVVNPEYVWSYEAGVKFKTIDNVLQANLAAFYYDYSDLVLSLVNGASTVLINASTATIKGAEAEITVRPAPGLRLDFSLGYLDATYGPFVTGDPVYPERGSQNVQGNPLSNAPKWSLRAGVDYTIPVGTNELTLFGEVAYQSEVWFTPFQDANTYQKGYATVNSRATYTLDDKWSVFVFGKNLSDVTAKTAAAVGPNFVGFPAFAGLNQPRTFGVGISFKH